MGKEDCRKWLEIRKESGRDQSNAESVIVLEVSAEERVKALLKLLKKLGIRKDKIHAADHNGRGPVSIDIYPNASIEQSRLPVIHIEAGKKKGLRYSVSSSKPLDENIFPGPENPEVLLPARDLLLPVMEGIRVGLTLKTHLNQNGDKFVYCLDEDTGAFRIALPRRHHGKKAVEIGDESVIGLEFHPTIRDGDAISTGRVMFLGPPQL